MNFGARRINPTIGRMDNVDGMANKFASHSLYNYALNRPLNIIDPDGNESRDIWGSTTFNGFVGDDGSGNFVGSTGGGGDDKEKGKKQEEAKKKKNSNNNKFIIPHNDGIEPDYTLEALFIPILKPIEWLTSSIKMYLFAGKIATKGVTAEGAVWAQKTFSGTISAGGKFAGQTVEGVAGALRSGSLSAAEVPIDVVVRNGQTFILNTRSSAALMQAGIPRSAWNVVNRTGLTEFEGRLTNQLLKNGIPGGTNTIKSGSTILTHR